MEHLRLAAASPGLQGPPETRRQGALDSIADIALDAQGSADVTAAVDAAGKTFSKLHRREFRPPGNRRPGRVSRAPLL